MRFGKQTLGTTDTVVSNGYQVASGYNNPVQDTFDKVFIYLSGLGSEVGNQVMKAAIWDESSGNPNILKAVSTEVTVIDNSPFAWIEFALTTPVVLAAGNYWLGYIAGNTDNSSQYRSEAIVNRKYKARSYALGPSDPFTTPDATDAFEVSIYAQSIYPSSHIPQVVSGGARWG